MIRKSFQLAKLVDLSRGKDIENIVKDGKDAEREVESELEKRFKLISGDENAFVVGEVHVAAVRSQ